MNQPKKNSMNAQASQDLNLEAVLKFPPPLKSAPDASTSFKDGDGDGDDLEGIRCFDIQVGLNGFFVSIIFESPEIADERFIVGTMEEVIEILRGEIP